MTTVFTSYMGKSIVKNSTIKIAVNNLPQIGTEKSILPFLDNEQRVAEIAEVDLDEYGKVGTPL